MRVVVVYFGSSNKFIGIAKAYVEGVSRQGHDVTLINGLKDSANLFVYDYLILGTEPLQRLSGRINIAAQHSLKNLGNLQAKPAYAFLLKKGFFANKSLQLWMKWLESCGLVLMLSDIVVKENEARLIGERINICK